MPSIFYETPEFYQKISKDGLIEDIYNAMETGDLSELVLIALEVLRKTNAVPNLKIERKSDPHSTAYRNEGNKEYTVGNYMKALSYYNKALLHAPANSQMMALAYSNRSALFFKIRAYSACIDDIATCLQIGCPLDIQEKLKKRKQECQVKIREEPTMMTLPDGFFRLNRKRNPDVPCAISAVEVVMESGLPKVVAAKDISVATIVAVEALFVSILNPSNQLLSCYYCHKMSLNLIPCAKCCFALFCNHDCKSKSMKDSHGIECEIVEVHQSICCSTLSRLVFTAVIKMKQRCKTWSEFINASKNVGMERMKQSSVREIFDSHNKFSLLSFVELRDVKFGSMFNFGFVCAALVHYLSKVQSFFPQPPNERHEAISAVARVMMRMLLYSFNNLEIFNVADDKLNGEIRHLVPNNASLSFAGKLKHCCEANLQLIGLNNKVALITVQPVKKGTELTISYIDHTYDHIYTPLVTTKERAVQLYRFHHTCQCFICDGTYTTYKGPRLTDEQTRCYVMWKRLYNDENNRSDRVFELTAHTLSALQGMCHTKEHQDVFVEFRKILSFFQYGVTRNTGPAE